MAAVAEVTGAPHAVAKVAAEVVARVMSAQKGALPQLLVGPLVNSTTLHHAFEIATGLAQSARPSLIINLDSPSC